MAGERIRQIGSALRKVTEKEVGSYLSKAELASHYDWLVEFIPRFDYSVGRTHANWKETGTNHGGKELPSASVIGKIVQPEGDGILKMF